MTNQKCIFCDIIKKTLPSQIVAETDDVLVIKDISPKAPIHYLLLPKKHIKDLRDLTLDDAKLAGNLLLMAAMLAEKENTAFRLVVNNGAEAGQVVFHAHVHFLAGKKMSHDL
ncbi:histidine triad nucleotide-binding protein [Candidatus Dependentiae bacterium Noda2021]|nr:histidine triad nucleotide-binding protein [Candidatus Dependentiae bacterium Noda2021]